MNRAAWAEHPGTVIHAVPVLGVIESARQKSCLWLTLDCGQARVSHGAKRSGVTRSLQTR
jgi:hypothetical protein